MRFTLLGGLIGALLAGNAYAAFPSRPQEKELGKFINQLLAEWHVPGMAIGIVDGESTWTKVRSRNYNLFCY